MRAPSGRLEVALAGGLLLALASCAPRLVGAPAVTAGARRELYLAALEGREAKATMASGEALVWTRAAGTGRLPAVQVYLALARPDAFRARVASAFGVALDLAARGDSVTAWAPGRREGLALDAVRDSLGVPGLGELAVRLWSADWRPPTAAWSAATWEESLLVVGWRERGDSLSLAVDRRGLPAWARLRRSDGSGARAAYSMWTRTEGADWPWLVEVENAARSFRVTCRLERLRFASRPDPAQLTVRIPADAERLEAGGLRRLLEELEGGR